MKYRKGMVFKSKKSKLMIILTSKKSGNGHWNCTKLAGRAKNHSIHEGTLEKFYEQVTSDSI